ncbi:amidohydrolase family protein [Bradyrhizobium tropiciagri]|uniref:amidohydrolase family protein n=1 Tax=Bradyrhizobium tropiciagri TaxID=312253 RepID=UPI001BA9FA7F|nr:amidohydrolase family protein [Bradyrhizobium tropiciagri]
MKAVDVHTHVVPLTLRAGDGRSDAWPSVERRSDDDAAVMIRGRAFRVIDSRSWDVERRLNDMKEDGIDVQVLSPMPELLSHWLPSSEADDLCAITNDYIAAMIAENPGQFRGIGMVPMQDPQLAAKRLEDVRKLGLRGIEIGTHIAGIPLGDPRLDPVYAQAEALGLVIFVHPLHPIGMERIGQPQELAAVSIFPLETAMATVALLGAQVVHRFPKLRLLLSHGGGAAPWIAPRIDFAYESTPLLKRHLPEAVGTTLKRFWYDTILYDSRSLQYLQDRTGADRLVVGSDYPFAIRQKQPADFARRALANVDFTANAAALLAEPNAGFVRDDA